MLLSVQGFFSSYSFAGFFNLHVVYLLVELKNTPHNSEKGLGVSAPQVVVHENIASIRSLGIARALVVVVMPPAFFEEGWKAFGDFIRRLWPEYLFFRRQTYSRTSPRTVLYFPPPFRFSADFWRSKTFKMVNLGR